MVNYISFISDLHLSVQRPDRTQCFANYLMHITPQCDALYILGDLFDCYLGKAQFPSFYNSVVSLMIEASTTTPIYFLPGNRDYLSHGTYFSTPPFIAFLITQSLMSLGFPPYSVMAIVFNHT